MPSFIWPLFAMAGVAAATGPVIIHLLNRRRYRVVEWAAMDFLREALQRNRKMLQIRDIILLVLRTACVLLFGLALARPFWTSAATATGDDGPVHVVLIVDNSQSMGYERLTGTLLEEAKRKASDFIETLPIGSRISVIPLCGSAASFSLDPYRTREDAREALKRIEVVDRQGRASHALDLALEACQLAPDLPAKRVAFLGDQQLSGWPAADLGPQLAKLPELQIVNLAADKPENAWVEAFRLQDAIADVDTTATFVATLGFEGPNARANVQVTLEVDGAAVASRSIDLEPGQIREVQFPYRFDVPVEPGQPTFVTASVSLQPESIEGDRLPADNKRYLAVPVVSSLPVVFVDQYGPKENPQRNEYGESFRLRRLLAPVTIRGEEEKQLVKIRHLSIDQLNQDVLADARLVVIAGAASPENTTGLLREYVQQGGQLLITAGGKFDPQAWTTAGWLDGAGILPLPLEPEPIGQLPEEATGQLDPFELDVESLVHDYFLLPDTPRDALADLYQEPFFFKAVAVDTRPEALQKLIEAEALRIKEDREFLAASDTRRERWTDLEKSGTLTDNDRAERDGDQAKRDAIEPHWLLWAQSVQAPSTETPEEIAAKSAPLVLAKLTRDALPFLIERRIGRGHLLFVSSGVYSDWNNLTKTNAALLFDRILRSMLEETLPRRTLNSVDQITLPVESGDRRVQYTLLRPGLAPESLPVDALGADAYGVTVRNITQAGTYLVKAERTAETTDAEAAEEKLWEVPLAVNGPASESLLTSLQEAELAKRVGAVNVRWIERDEEISLAGAQVHGKDAWWWLMLLVLLLLLTEMTILAWPTLSRITLAPAPAPGGQTV